MRSLLFSQCPVAGSAQVYGIRLRPIAASQNALSLPGKFELRDESSLERKVRISPNHACLCGG